MATKKNLAGGAAAATAKIFSNAQTKPEKKSTTVVAQEKEEKIKTPKQVFSFRGEVDDVKAWRLYANITGTKVDDLGSLALQEYLKNHPLKGAEKALFDERMK